MTTFIDGPAKGQSLMLKRCMRFLRVVEANGKWDALDQVGDTPASNEKLYAYELAESPSYCHLNFGGGRGGFYPMALFKLAAVQPTDEIMRTRAAWEKWCEARPPSDVKFGPSTTTPYPPLQ